MNVIIRVSPDEYNGLKKHIGCDSLSKHLVQLLQLGITEAQLNALKARATSQGMRLADLVRTALELGTAKMPANGSSKP